MSHSPRAVIAALLDGARRQTGVLGVVTATDGSTYAKAGALLSLGSAPRAGWISGGCLEPALEAEALRIEHGGIARLLEVDTRDDMDLMFGSRIGCRGLLRLALVPLATLPGIDRHLQDWLDHDQALRLEGDTHGFATACRSNPPMRWPLEWQADGGIESGLPWSLAIAPAPRVLVLGAGPETAALLRQLRELGARVDLVERRSRWTGHAADADRWIDATPTQALADASLARYDQVLVMNHDFELDRESLDALSATTLPWIGLLGPPRRRDDLLALLTPSQCDALLTRLHAPVGLALGGRGPEAIALSIAAQLQQRWSAA